MQSFTLQRGEFSTPHHRPRRPIAATFHGASMPAVVARYLRIFECIPGHFQHAPRVKPAEQGMDAMWGEIGANQTKCHFSGDFFGLFTRVRVGREFSSGAFVVADHWHGVPDRLPLEFPRVSTPMVATFCPEYGRTQARTSASGFRGAQLGGLKRSAGSERAFA